MKESISSYGGTSYPWGGTISIKSAKISFFEPADCHNHFGSIAFHYDIGYNNSKMVMMVHRPKKIKKSTHFYMRAAWYLGMVWYLLVSLVYINLAGVPPALAEDTIPELPHKWPQNLPWKLPPNLPRKWPPTLPQNWPPNLHWKRPWHCPRSGPGTATGPSAAKWYA